MSPPRWDDGYTTFLLILERRFKTITVRAPGYAPVHHKTGLHLDEIKPDTPTTFEAHRIRVLEPGERLGGRCVDKQGRAPLGSVWIEVNRGRDAADLLLRANEDGSFWTDQAPRRQ